MAIRLCSLFSGLLFGYGLALSEMVNPARVVGFLDVAGAWDPTLAMVMLGALTITATTFPFVLRRPAPVFAPEFDVPGRRDIDARLLGGALLFGIGWGIAGFCPGPAIAALMTGMPDVALFVAAMFGGFYLVQRLDGRGSGA